MKLSLVGFEPWTKKNLVGFKPPTSPTQLVHQRTKSLSRNFEVAGCDLGTVQLEKFQH